MQNQQNIMNSLIFVVILVTIPVIIVNFPHFVHLLLDGHDRAELLPPFKWKLIYLMNYVKIVFNHT